MWLGFEESELKKLMQMAYLKHLVLPVMVVRRQLISDNAHQVSQWYTRPFLWTQTSLPPWRLKKLTRCMSISKVINYPTILLIYWTISLGPQVCFKDSISRSAVGMVFLWIRYSQSFWTQDCLVSSQFKFVSNLLIALGKPYWHGCTDLYYLAFPLDRLYTKCLVYGIYLLEFVQSILIIEAGFRTFVNGFGDLEVLDQIKTQWLSIPVLTAIGELSSTRCRWRSNIQPRYIFCPGILCI